VRSLELRAITLADIGSSCTYVDPTGKPRQALITNVFGDKCCNVVFVNEDTAQSDSYGRKLERATSVMRKDVQQAHGNYWH